MPDSILVVEYEPRYADRVRQALEGQPIAASFARDGEEALRAIAEQSPKLIVLSSIVPKVAAPDLIRAIRNESKFQATPILLTVSGYSGATPKADAERMGASDILPKPYSESEFLFKVHQMLGMPVAAAETNIVHPTHPASAGGAGALTSNDLFGDLTDDGAAAKRASRASADVDRMLAETLAGVMPQKRKDSSPPSAAPKPAAAPRPKTQSGNLELDKLMEDTLSGLERRGRPAVAAKPPAPPPPAPMPVASPAADIEPPTMISKQLIVTPAPPPVVHEEEEPVDGIGFGQYVLLEKIATGGMAEVWRARMRGVEGFQKIVAIKKILPHLSDNQDFVEMFIDEAKLAAQLSHTNIVHIFDLGKIQSSYFIAMEYVEGLDLKTILKRAEQRDHPMQIELALFITSKIAAALDYAHRRRDFENRDLGLVHRDVSPQNVLISQEGDIKLCDFGIAKAASKASHTQTGALKGKLQYMSPEQASGQPIDRRSDIFSLAVVLFEMLTRRKLFAADSELSVLDMVRAARVSAPSQFNDEVPPEVDAVVLKALNRDPDLRYQTAAEMARDIDHILYSFKPTPTSADLAIFMHRLTTSEPFPIAEPAHEAVTETRPAEKTIESRPSAPPPPPAALAAPVPAAIPLVRHDREVAEVPPPAKRPPIAAIAAVAVVVVLGAAGWFLMRGKSPAAAVPAPATSLTTRTTSTTTTAAPLPASTTAAAPSSTAAAVPAIDAAKVDEEVRKRLEAEKLKLEKSQAAAPAANAIAPKKAPAPQAAAIPAATPAAVPPPQPAPVQSRPAPPPVPAPQPAVESRPAPAPAPAEPAVETPRTREGDLVQPGTEGLAPAHILRQAYPVYPPMARAQRVEGRVLVNVLVSETGQILDAKVITGVNRPVGINEAAVETVRRSSFAAGSKDGVKVKSWTTVTVNFKL